MKNEERRENEIGGEIREIGGVSLVFVYIW
jgi:hypothetical protein